MTADGWSIRALADAMGRVPFALRALPIPFRLSRPRLASSEQLRPDMLRVIRRAADLAVVAIYDDPVSQTASLGMRMSSPKTALYTARRVGNIDAFRWHAVPTASFAALIGLDLDRAIVAGNGTDVKHIRPGPWPARPTVGMVSGAAPGRGIENLVTAAREIREEMRELRLLLWLVPTGPESEDYLTRLRLSVAADSWIEITSVDYAEISAALSQATVLAVPHPPGAYMDVALPVKVFDSMAAGRPLVITPRTETRDLVLRHAAGEVAGGDRPEDIATALVRVLNDEAAARRMGEAARAAAVEQYDWPVVGERLALEVLRREGALSAAAVFSSSSGTGALNG
ncbi:MAG: glycosyltransferase family 4 protein [Chloroflexota bacterium]